MDSVQLTHGVTRHVLPNPAAPSLVLRVPCWSDPSATEPSASHQVTIGADWSVDTPHDLEAERVATAFGGYCSCLHLVDVVVPTARRWAGQMARWETAPLTRRKGGRWAPGKRAGGCCNEARTFASAGEAGNHVRSLKHVAAASGSDLRLLRAVCSTLRSAHKQAGTFALTEADAAAASTFVTDGDGLLALWDAGIHPSVVMALHRELQVGTHALPVALYLSLAFGDLSRKFARATLSPQLGDRLFDDGLADLADWVTDTETPFDRAHPEQRAQLLELGFTRHLAHTMSACQITVNQIQEYARGTGLTATTAGQVLAEWSRAGAPPDVDRMLAAVAEGMRPTFTCGHTVVHKVKALLGPTPGIDAVDVVIAVAITGSTNAAVFWLRQGHTDPRALALLMRQTREQFPNISRKIRQREAKDSAP